MDIAALISAVELGNKAISLFKKTIELIPNGPEKEVVDKSFNEAEKAFKLAEVKTAQELGYQLCKCTWPPQIMLSIGYEEYDEKFKCPKCNRIWPPAEPPLPNNWRTT